jgi:hypothetical protein
MAWRPAPVAPEVIEPPAQDDQNGQQGLDNRWPCLTKLGSHAAIRVKSATSLVNKTLMCDDATHLIPTLVPKPPKSGALAALFGSGTSLS